jgi:hypothetical protein
MRATSGELVVQENRSHVELHLYSSRRGRLVFSEATTLRREVLWGSNLDKGREDILIARLAK